MASKVPTRCGPGDIMRATFGTKQEKKKAVAMGCGCQMSELKPMEPDKKDLHGWEAKKPESKRRKKLEKAVGKRGCRPVLWSLTMTYMSAKDEKTRAAAKSDAFWLQQQGACSGKK